jgi:hypothetical protein
LRRDWLCWACVDVYLEHAVDFLSLISFIVRVLIKDYHFPLRLKTAVVPNHMSLAMTLPYLPSIKCCFIGRCYYFTEFSQIHSSRFCFTRVPC